MVFVNPVPIANAAQMGPDVVKDCMAALFGAVEDLIRQDKDVSLQMGIDNVIDYILSKPTQFPGKQNSATERTVGHQQPVEPKH
jgi:hypothetical protein